MRQKNIFVKKIEKLQFFRHITFSEFLWPFTLGLIFAILTFYAITNPLRFTIDLIVFLSVTMILQGIFFIYLMLYAWENDTKIAGNRNTRSFSKKKHHITALVPARHEAKVIEDTIRAINNIDYPDRYKETIIICRADDLTTIKSVKKTIKAIRKKNIKLIIFNSLPINKPHSLNIGLKEAKHEVIVIFDAEDQPHVNIYNNVNTVMQRENADAVQSGVQLMNYRSSWFSLFNVLEYYFWFKSSLHFFAKKGSVPLGGNSVFFKKNLLEKIGGWDESCLTEDADVGFRLSLSGAKVKIIYNEGNATQEETPPTLNSFIKQRTRWNQGFIQILLKGDWLRLPKKRQKLLAGYILLIPELQSLLFLIIPVSIFMAFMIKLPLFITMLTIIPLMLLLLQLTMLNVGLYEFTKSYKLRYPFWISLYTILYFYPYQIILGLSALRAIVRLFQGNINWEKTHHTNAHREQPELTSYTPATIT